jgi:hypothetical protein
MKILIETIVGAALVLVWLVVAAKVDGALEAADARERARAQLVASTDRTLPR